MLKLTRKNKGNGRKWKERAEEKKTNRLTLVDFFGGKQLLCKHKFPPRSSLMF